MIIASSSLEHAKRTLMAWVDEDKPEYTHRSWEIVMSTHEDALSGKFPVKVTLRLESMVGYGDKRQKIANLQLVRMGNVDSMAHAMIQEINQKEWDVRYDLEGRR